MSTAKQSPNNQQGTGGLKLKIKYSRTRGFVSDFVDSEECSDTGEQCEPPSYDSAHAPEFADKGFSQITSSFTYQKAFDCTKTLGHPVSPSESGPLDLSLHKSDGLPSSKINSLFDVNVHTKELECSATNEPSEQSGVTDFSRDTDRHLPTSSNSEPPDVNYGQVLQDLELFSSQQDEPDGSGSSNPVGGKEQHLTATSTTTKEEATSMAEGKSGLPGEEQAEESQDDNSEIVEFSDTESEPMSPFDINCSLGLADEDFTFSAPAQNAEKSENGSKQQPKENPLFPWSVVGSTEPRPFFPVEPLPSPQQMPAVSSQSEHVSWFSTQPNASSTFVPSHGSSGYGLTSGGGEGGMRRLIVVDCRNRGNSEQEGGPNFAQLNYSSSMVQRSLAPSPMSMTAAIDNYRTVPVENYSVFGSSVPPQSPCVEQERNGVQQSTKNLLLKSLLDRKNKAPNALRGLVTTHVCPNTFPPKSVEEKELVNKRQVPHPLNRTIDELRKRVGDTTEVKDGLSLPLGSSSPRNADSSQNGDSSIKKQTDSVSLLQKNDSILLSSDSVKKTDSSFASESGLSKQGDSLSTPNSVSATRKSSSPKSKKTPESKSTDSVHKPHPSFQMWCRCEEPVPDDNLEEYEDLAGNVVSMPEICKKCWKKLSKRWKKMKCKKTRKKKRKNGNLWCRCDKPEPFIPKGSIAEICRGCLYRVSKQWKKNVAARWCRCDIPLLCKSGSCSTEPSESTPESEQLYTCYGCKKVISKSREGLGIDRNWLVQIEGNRVIPPPPVQPQPVLNDHNYSMSPFSHRQKLLLIPVGVPIRQTDVTEALKSSDSQRQNLQTSTTAASSKKVICVYPPSQKSGRNVYQPVESDKYVVVRGNNTEHGGMDQLRSLALLDQKMASNISGPQANLQIDCITEPPTGSMFFTSALSGVPSAEQSASTPTVHTSSETTCQRGSKAGPKSSKRKMFRQAKQPTSPHSNGQCFLTPCYVVLEKISENLQNVEAAAKPPCPVTCREKSLHLLCQKGKLQKCEHARDEQDSSKRIMVWNRKRDYFRKHRTLEGYEEYRQRELLRRCNKPAKDQEASADGVPSSEGFISLSSLCSAGTTNLHISEEGVFQVSDSPRKPRKQKILPRLLQGSDLSFEQASCSPDHGDMVDQTGDDSQMSDEFWQNTPGKGVMKESGVYDTPSTELADPCALAYPDTNSNTCMKVSKFNVKYYVFQCGNRAFVVPLIKNNRSSRGIKRLDEEDLGYVKEVISQLLTETDSCARHLQYPDSLQHKGCRRTVSQCANVEEASSSSNKKAFVAPDFGANSLDIEALKSLISDRDFSRLVPKNSRISKSRYLQQIGEKVHMYLTGGSEEAPEWIKDVAKSIVMKNRTVVNKKKRLRPSKGITIEIDYAQENELLDVGQEPSIELDNPEEYADPLTFEQPEVYEGVDQTDMFYQDFAPQAETTPQPTGSYVCEEAFAEEEKKPLLGELMQAVQASAIPDDGTSPAAGQQIMVPLPQGGEYGQDGAAQPSASITCSLPGNVPQAEKLETDHGEHPERKPLLGELLASTLFPVTSEAASSARLQTGFYHQHGDEQPTDAAVPQGISTTQHVGENLQPKCSYSHQPEENLNPQVLWPQAVVKQEPPEEDFSHAWHNQAQQQITADPSSGQAEVAAVPFISNSTFGRGVVQLEEDSRCNTPRYDQQHPTPQPVAAVKMEPQDYEDENTVNVPLIACVASGDAASLWENSNADNTSSAEANNLPTVAAAELQEQSDFLPKITSVVSGESTDHGDKVQVQNSTAVHKLSTVTTAFHNIDQSDTEQKQVVSCLSGAETVRDLVHRLVDSHAAELISDGTTNGGDSQQLQEEDKNVEGPLLQISAVISGEAAKMWEGEDGVPQSDLTEEPGEENQPLQPHGSSCEFQSDVPVISCVASGEAVAHLEGEAVDAVTSGWLEAADDDDDYSEGFDNYDEEHDAHNEENLTANVREGQLVSSTVSLPSENLSTPQEALLAAAGLQVHVAVDLSIVKQEPVDPETEPTDQTEAPYRNHDYEALQNAFHHPAAKSQTYSESEQSITADPNHLATLGAFSSLSSAPEISTFDAAANPVSEIVIANKQIFDHGLNVACPAETENSNIASYESPATPTILDVKSLASMVPKPSAGKSKSRSRPGNSLATRKKQQKTSKTRATRASHPPVFETQERQTLQEKSPHPVEDQQNAVTQQHHETAHRQVFPHLSDQEQSNKTQESSMSHDFFTETDTVVGKGEEVSEKVKADSLVAKDSEAGDKRHTTDNNNVEGSVDDEKKKKECSQLEVSQNMSTTAFDTGVEQRGFEENSKEDDGKTEEQSSSGTIAEDKIHDISHLNKDLVLETIDEKGQQELQNIKPKPKKLRKKKGGSKSRKKVLKPVTSVSSDMMEAAVTTDTITAVSFTSPTKDVAVPATDIVPSDTAVTTLSTSHTATETQDCRVSSPLTSAAQYTSSGQDSARIKLRITRSGGSCSAKFESSLSSPVPDSQQIDASPCSAPEDKDLSLKPLVVLGTKKPSVARKTVERTDAVEGKSIPPKSAVVEDPSVHATITSESPNTADEETGSSESSARSFEVSGPVRKVSRRQASVAASLRLMTNPDVSPGPIGSCSKPDSQSSSKLKGNTGTRISGKSAADASNDGGTETGVFGKGAPESGKAERAGAKSKQKRRKVGPRLTLRKKKPAASRSQLSALDSTAGELQQAVTETDDGASPSKRLRENTADDGGPLEEGLGRPTANLSLKRKFEESAEAEDVARVSVCRTNRSVLSDFQTILDEKSPTRPSSSPQIQAIKDGRTVRERAGLFSSLQASLDISTVGPMADTTLPELTDPKAGLQNQLPSSSIFGESKASTSKAFDSTKVPTQADMSGTNATNSTGLFSRLEKQMPSASGDPKMVKLGASKMTSQGNRTANDQPGLFSRLQASAHSEKDVDRDSIVSVQPLVPCSSTFPESAAKKNKLDEVGLFSRLQSLCTEKNEVVKNVSEKGAVSASVKDGVGADMTLKQQESVSSKSARERSFFDCLPQSVLDAWKK